MMSSSQTHLTWYYSQIFRDNDGFWTLAHTKHAGGYIIVVFIYEIDSLSTWIRFLEWVLRKSI